MKLKKIRNLVIKFALLLLGSAIAAVGLEIFLVPNNIIDGGIVGISIISSHLSKLPLGLFTFVLNVPFLILGYRHIGKTFVISSLFSISAFSIFISLLHPVAGLTDDVLLATVFGGIILGVGVGFILRSGGSLDGSEIVAIILSRRSFLSVGQIVMIINIVIFSLAALALGWDRALYSMIAYFIAHKAIDIIVEGFDEAKAVMIISEETDEITELIGCRLGRSVMTWEGKAGCSNEARKIIYAVVTRIEISKLRDIALEQDPHAFISVQDVADVTEGSFKKRAIH